MKKKYMRRAIKKHRTMRINEIYREQCQRSSSYSRNRSSKVYTYYVERWDAIYYTAKPKCKLYCTWCSFELASSNLWNGLRYNRYEGQLCIL